jgi:molybdopterin-guanine dinucleotide biosynthesis protein A/molybdopterin-guanine dinucleotide biosynthesis protein
MPLMQAGIISGIAEKMGDTRAQAIVPKTGALWQPLCAAYHRDCLPAMENSIASGKLGIVDLLPLLSVESVGVPAGDQQLFRNINTERDWQEVQSISGVLAT